MDENFLEQAEANIQSEIDAGIKRAQARSPKPSNFDGTCDCGEAIPEKRIELGYYRCFYCQDRLEKEGRRIR